MYSLLILICLFFDLRKDMVIILFKSMAEKILNLFFTNLEDCMNANQSAHNYQAKNKRLSPAVWACLTLGGLLILALGTNFMLTHYPASPYCFGQPVTSKHATLVLPNRNVIQVIVPPGNTNNTIALDSLLDRQPDIEKGIHEEWATFNVPTGYPVITVKLPDGTRIALNAGSSLRFPTYFPADRRYVFLERGEAYVDVTPDPLRIFTLYAKGMEVKILGTSFNINTNRKLQISLVSGKVLVSFKGKERQLDPGYAATFDRHSGELTVGIFDKDQLLWRQGVYKFTKIPLDEVCEVVSRMYGVNINVPKAFASKVISGSVNRNNDISDFFSDIFRYGISYSYDKNGDITLK